jgi:hypothetical protein
MRLFIMLIFYLSMLGFIVHLLSLTFLEFPRTVKYSRTETLLKILESLAMAVWAAILLWL